MSTNEHETFTVLVTGANSGLGLAICQRLIDEFLHTRPATQSLLLIPTTRSTSKSEATIATLSQYVVNHAHAASKKKPGIGPSLEARVRFHPEFVDLTSLRSVRALARRLCDEESSIRRIDCIMLNAGLGGWKGLNWPGAIRGVLTDLIHQVTWPSFKIAETGGVTKPQLPESVHTEHNKTQEPPLASIFCANVFGHYMLTHSLLPLLLLHHHHHHQTPRPARIIWISSLEAYPHALNSTDIQGLRSATPYETSKRLTDVLALTAHLPSTAPWTSTYFSTPAHRRPRMFTAHPGICATAILPIPWLLTFAMFAAFYLARWLGSIWHTIDPYTGATAPVWLALAAEKTLDAFEAPYAADVPEQPRAEELAAARRVGKWGSATDAEGRERVERTEVEGGWGWDGRPGTQSVTRLRGRRRGAEELTEKERKRFEELGGECWKEMERLRGVWEGLLEGAEK